MKIKVEDYRKSPKTFKEIIIPKGYRLLKIQEVIDLVNSGKFKFDKNRWLQFFFEQPFDINKKLERVAVLGSYVFDDRLGVGADGSEGSVGRCSFGVFIKMTDEIYVPPYHYESLMETGDIVLGKFVPQNQSPNPSEPNNMPRTELALNKQGTGTEGTKKPSGAFNNINLGIFDTTDLEKGKIKDYEEIIFHGVAKIAEYFDDVINKCINLTSQRLKAEVEKSFERLKEKIINKNAKYGNYSFGLDKHFEKLLIEIIDEEKKRLGI